MSACLLVAGKALALAAPAFTLGWTHSIEKTAWIEHWRLAGHVLVLEKARIKGSGAGMEPDPAARLVDGWWEWQPDLRTAEIVLAASGATSGGWQLCSAGTCHVLGREAGAPLRIAPCP